MRFFPAVSIALLVVALPAKADTPPATDRIPILLDTDIGSDIDDAFALALVCPELDLQGVTTVGAAAGYGDRSMHLAPPRNRPGRAESSPAMNTGEYVHEILAR
jgi:hypothetical protein